MEAEGLRSEIENIASAFEGQQEKISRLTKQLGEKDDAIVLQQNEKLKTVHIQNIMKDEKSTLETKIQFLEGKIKKHEELQKKYDERQKTQEELTNSFKDEVSKNGIIIDDLKRHITYNNTRLADIQKVQGDLEKKNVLLEENLNKETSKFEMAQFRKQSYKEKMVLLERNLTRVSNEGGDSLTQEENKMLKKKITCNICDDKEKISYSH